MRILFVGNSFTSRNDLPGTVRKLAAARGEKVETKLISAGGASLRQHLNAGQVAAELAKSKYDVVVLQEQSTLPYKNPVRTGENIRDFDPIIRAAGARTALYLTWARRNAPEHQQAITTAYLTSAAEVGATVVPVGLVWERFLASYDEPVLHDPDNSHPAPAGSYLAACVFLISLLELDPTGLSVPVGGITADTATFLAGAAWSITENLAAGT